MSDSGRALVQSMNRLEILKQQQSECNIIRGVRKAENIRNPIFV